ncbi:calcium-binding protein [Planktothrix agardhii 1033]|jgi:serralysin|nr:calcium-binding protein [Planktothrix agardhii 1033]
MSNLLIFPDVPQKTPILEDIAQNIQQNSTPPLSQSSLPDRGLVIQGFLNTTNIFPGSTANEIISAGNQADAIYGNSGNDSILGFKENDTLLGGDGDDTIHGGQNNDLIVGDNGNDLVYGDQGDDTVFGREGSDVIYGSEGKDTLDGGENSDTIYGGKGNDSIVGGKGDDILSGNKGNDILTSSEGKDTFAYIGNGDDINTEFGLDTLTDFNPSEDQIVLSAETFTAISIDQNGLIASGEFTTIADFSGNSSDAGDANLVYDPQTGLLYYIDPQGITNPLVDIGKNLTLTDDNFEIS